MINAKRNIFSSKEYKILNIAVKNKMLQAGDLKKIFPDKIPAEISRMIRNIKEKNMLDSFEEHWRIYYINFSNSILMRSVVKKLDENWFLPIRD